MKLILSRIKKTEGQAAAALNLILGVCAVGLIAVFCFELSRYFLSRDELKSNTEAAALCCETALVTSGDPTNSSNQTNAVNTALTLFQQNTILGQPMTSAIAQTGNSELSPAPGQAQICFQFLDPVTRQPIIPGSGASGALIQATGAYCYTPAFGQVLGFGNAQFTFQVSTFSGVPRVDVVLAFDISGGTDDQTYVTPPQRGSNGSGSGTGGGGGGGDGGGGGGGGGGGTCSVGINYMFPNGSNSSAFMGGSILDMCGHTNSGTSPLPNALPPQQLETATGITYSELSTATQGLAGYNGNSSSAAYMGVAPGNFCFSCPPSSGGKGGGGGNGGGQVNYLNNNKKSQLIASAKTDSLSDISFAPLFSTYAQVEMTNPGTSGPPVAPYSSGGYTYSPCSHAPGGLPPFSDPSAIPGKCVSGVSPIIAGSAAPNVFTDLMANIDGNPVFAGNYTSVNGFIYTDISTITESARGNLESSTVAGAALVDVNGMGITPTPGYASDYYANAQLALQPYNNLLNAVAALINEMKSVADVHFSFIAFNDTAGSSATGTTPAQYADNAQTGYLPMISSAFPYPMPAPTNSGVATYILPPLPFIPLDPNNAHTDIISQIPNMSPNGNRNVAAGLQAAIGQLTTNSRPGANKAIVLFSSGVPTEANIANSVALQDALTQAQSAATNSIPIYCVTVADPLSTTSPTDDSLDDTAYNDNNGGITAVSAPGPSLGQKYYRVDWTNITTNLSNLSTVVDNIVRQMVGMMH